MASHKGLQRAVCPGMTVFTQVQEAQTWLQVFLSSGIIHQFHAPAALPPKKEPIIITV